MNAGILYKKMLPSFLALIVLSVGFYVLRTKNVPFVSAGTEHNVAGYLWSETIGWLSLNSTTGGGSDYGVNVSNPGAGLVSNFSGYGWSENIGWVQFDPGSGFPGAPYHGVQVDNKTQQLSGWARALSANGNGWDGWINFGPTTNNSNGVKRSNCALTGYAWGSDVVGWVGVSGTTTNGSHYGAQLSNYACENHPATITFGPNACNPTSFPGGTCAGIAGMPSGQPVGSLDIIPTVNDSDIWEQPLMCQYKIDGGSFSPPQKCSDPIHVSAIVTTPGTHTLTVQVNDGVWMPTQSIQFTLRKDMSLDFKCSLDTTNWQGCGSLANVLPGAWIYVKFKDYSMPSGHDGFGPDASWNSWGWNFGGGTPLGASGSGGGTDITKVKFSSDGGHTIILTATDSWNRSRLKQYQISIKKNPNFKEVAPE